MDQLDPNSDGGCGGKTQDAVWHCTQHRSQSLRLKSLCCLDDAPHRPQFLFVRLLHTGASEYRPRLVSWAPILKPKFSTELHLPSTTFLSSPKCGHKRAPAVGALTLVAGGSSIRTPARRATRRSTRSTCSSPSPSRAPPHSSAKSTARVADGTTALVVQVVAVDLAVTCARLRLPGAGGADPDKKAYCREDSATAIYTRPR